MAETADRAAWTFSYEKGLVDILTEHKNQPRFKGQNGWNSEGWKSITLMFNEKYPLAQFSKKQLQDKDKELKGSYKAIRDAKKESGTGWNEEMGLITAEPHIWARCLKKYPKIKKHQKKGFPLFRRCEVLYEGSIATGDLNFTSTEPVLHAPEPLPPFDTPTENFLAEHRQLTENTPSASEANEHTVANPFTRSVDEVQSAPSGTAGTSEESGSGKKRKQNQIASSLDDYVAFKKQQTSKKMEVMLEKRMQEDEYSVKKCVTKLYEMELTKEEKAAASEVFETNINRQIFINHTDPSVRLLWLRRKLSRLAST